MSRAIADAFLVKDSDVTAIYEYVCIPVPFKVRNVRRVRYFIPSTTGTGRAKFNCRREGGVVCAGRDFANRIGKRNLKASLRALYRGVYNMANV